MFDIYLPIAQITANWLLILAVGVLTGICAGIFGVGGGLITIPYLTWMGVPIHVAIATSTNQMTAASVSSVIAYADQKKIDYKFANLMLFGSLFGIYMGIRQYDGMLAAGSSDKYFAQMLFIMMGIATFLAFQDGVKILLKKKAGAAHSNASKALINLPYQRSFVLAKGTISVGSPILMGLMAGYLVALLGIGGGIILTPIMLYMLAANEKYIVGTSHFLMMFTSICAILMHSLDAPNIDIILAIFLIIGVSIGAQIGAMIAKKIKADNFRLMFALMLFATTVNFGYKNFIAPVSPLNVHLIGDNPIAKFCLEHSLYYSIGAIFIACVLALVVAQIAKWIRKY